MSLLGSIVLSETETLQHLHNAGFEGKLANTMVCVAKYESALDPSAINTNRNQSKDYGLLQINDYWWKDHCEIGKLLDPAYNAQCAKLVYDKQGLNAWYGYKKNKATCDNYIPAKSVCPTPRIVNETDRPWNSRDDEVLKNARKTCKERYAPSVCLVEFRRFNNYNYHAICGKEVDK
jgi:hypothetical protein